MGGVVVFCILLSENAMSNSDWPEMASSGNRAASHHQGPSGMDGRRTINLDLLAGLNQSTLIACLTPSSRTARRHPLPTNPPKKRWELRLCALH